MKVDAATDAASRCVTARVERHRADQRVGREGVMDGEPGGLARVFARHQRLRGSSGESDSNRWVTRRDTRTRMTR
jgi:hypothetical protein